MLKLILTACITYFSIVFNEHFAGNSDLDPDRNFVHDQGTHQTSYDYLLSDQFVSKFGDVSCQQSFSLS